MTLRLPAPGTPRGDVLARAPECAAHADPLRCRFHGWIRPLASPCEDGCTWWTYEFVDDRLHAARLERAIWDVDDVMADGFVTDARRVAAEITARVGLEPQVEALATWADVEASEEGQTSTLERRSWRLGDRSITWTLEGTQAHHPGIALHVRVERAPAGDAPPGAGAGDASALPARGRSPGSAARPSR